VDNNYRKISLQWTPESQGDSKRFNTIFAVVLFATLFLSVFIASVNVPLKTERVLDLPERVAQYLSEKPKPPPPPPPVAPPPPPPPVVTEVKPTVVRKLEQEEVPLTEEEKVARDTASQSGLVALSNELSDLLDSSAADTSVRGGLTEGSAKTEAASVSTDALLAGTPTATQTVNDAEYVAQVGSSQLGSRDRANVKQTLFKENEKGEVAAAGKTGKPSTARTGNVRSEEAISMVFDQNKAGLFSIYNRERRNTPGLKGKLVLELTIAPDGSVISVRVVSSELNSPGLEQRILGRVKLFNFGPGNVEPVKVTFPIEFLPS
jgi:periplasmic protein TonB